MVFQIIRTSKCDNDKPCEEAFEIELTNVEVRTLNTPEQFNARFGKREGNWLSKGTNHRINSQGYITRDNGKIKVWGIKINTLKDLMLLNNKYGNLVLYTSYVDDTTPAIEIYDTYRE